MFCYNKKREMMDKVGLLKKRKMDKKAIPLRDKKDLFLMGVFFSICFLMFLGLVFGAVVFIAPVTESNYSGTNGGLVTFNASFVNATDLVIGDSELSNMLPYLNASFYYNTSAGVITELVNATPLACGGTDPLLNTTLACWGSFNVSGITSIANTSISVTFRSNNTQELNKSLLLVTFDNTGPVSQESNFVFKYGAIGVVPVAAITGSNYTNGSVILNATIVDAHVGHVSTVVFNISNSTNSTTFSGSLDKASDTWWNSSFNITGKGLGTFVEGIYDITIWSNDTLGNINNTNIIPIAIDWTVPSFVNITNPQVESAGVSKSHRNVSQLLNLNVSVTDNVAGPGTVLIVFENVTGGQNTTMNYTLTHEGATSYWSLVLNTTHIPDGNYNITAYVNDSAGNLNNTYCYQNKIDSVMIDNSAPSISASLNSRSKYNLDISLTHGDGIGTNVSGTCTSNRTGSTIVGSGSGVTQNLTEASLSCGQTYSYLITCTDYAGNIGTLTTSQSTSSCGDQSSSGDSGSSSSSPSIKKTQSFSKITPGVVTIMKDFNPDVGIKQIEISVTSEAQNVQISVSKYDSKPAAVSVAKSGEVYKYLEIKVDNIGNKLEKGLVTIRVERSWVAESGLDRDEIAMFRFDGTKWQELPTEFKEEDTGNYYYDVELTEFSYFVIGQKEESSEPSTTITKAISKAWLWILIVVAIIVIAVVAYVLYSKKK